MRKKNSEDNKKNNILKIVAIVILTNIITILIIAGIIFIVPRNLNNNENKIIEKISKIMVLPDEKPIINTIKDAKGLKSESPFYNNVENGDKILIYTQSAKIIIYREKENKIINVGPIINDTDYSNQ